MSRRTSSLLAALLIAAVGLAESAHAQSPASGTGGAPAEAGLSAPDFWLQIRESNDPAQFEEFLRLYPDHPLAPLAQARLDTLRGRAAAAPETAPQVPTAPGQSAATPAPGAGPQSVFGAPATAPQPTQEQLAVDLQAALQAVGCYTRGIDGDWGSGSRAALDRFNAMAGTDFDTVTPTPEALATVRAWSGGNCKAVVKAKPKTQTVKKKTTTKRTVRTTRKPPATGGGSGGGSGGSGIGVIIGGGGGGIGIGF